MVSLVTDVAVGDKVGAAVNVVSDKMAAAFQKIDKTLTSQEAKVLAVGVLMTTSTYISLKGDIAHAGDISKQANCFFWKLCL